LPTVNRTPFSVCGTDGKLSCGRKGYETAAGMTRRFSFL